MSGSVSPKTASGEEHENTSPDSRGTVLIVDDAALLCDGLERVLRLAGFKSVSANNGRRALELIEKEHFDVVVTDVQMPLMSGLDLVERLQQIAPRLRCIIMTGNATRAQLRTLAGKPNVVGILMKPWDRQRLIETVCSVIDQKNDPETTESVE